MVVRQPRKCGACNGTGYQTGHDGIKRRCPCCIDGIEYPNGYVSC